jgi:hypothetical protein
MAYIGKGLVGVLSENKAVDTMSNPNGVLTTMTLSRTPGSVNNVEVYIDGIFQTPGDEFTLAGDVLTFTTAPATNAVVIAVVGNDSTIANVDNNSITGAMIPDGSVTDSKISGINSTKISGTLPALDGSSLTNLTTGNLQGILPALDGSPLTGVSGFRKNSSDPLINSNGNQGDVWVNTASGEVYVLTDATTNANVWFNVGGGTGDVVPIPLSLASGGTLTTDGDYNVHTFTSSDPLTFSVADAPVEYLVVAGGGGGGTFGGGGAGGYRTASSFLVSETSYSITVGAGGSASGSEDGSNGGDGGNSVFSSITSTGGGGGGAFSNSNRPGRSGGSGGGAGAGHTSPYSSGAVGAGNTPSTSPVQGYNGGLATNGATAGGAGGGASEIGGNSSTNNGGAGGDGRSSSITGSPITRAGGGGGPSGGGSLSGRSLGGLGGGGDGWNSVNTSGSVSAGGTNLGAGGGGAYTYAGAAGGSGVVIVRYRAR